MAPHQMGAAERRFSRKNTTANTDYAQLSPRSASDRHRLSVKRLILLLCIHFLFLSGGAVTFSSECTLRFNSLLSVSVSPSEETLSDLYSVCKCFLADFWCWQEMEIHLLV